MSDIEGSPLWRISAFELHRSNAASASGQSLLLRQTLLSTTLQAELRLLERRRDHADALEVIAACVRLREPALIYLRTETSVWPVTVFPQQMVYHSPRSLLLGSRRDLLSLKTLDIEPPGVRPPGHWMHDRIAAADTYHTLTPALWRLGLQGPRRTLLNEIAGTAAYRVLRNPALLELPVPSALTPALERLRTRSAALRSIARWPEMTEERANRMLNALYLTSNLLVSRTHHTARSGLMDWLFGSRGG